MQISGQRKSELRVKTIDDDALLFCSERSMLDQLTEAYSRNPLPPRYDGIIATLDLDKTYLATEFEKLSGLVRIPFEAAEEKKNIPGAAALVREIRRGARSDVSTPVFFISGSPKAMRNVVLEKLELDGVHINGIVFKEFRTAIRRMKFRQIIDKIGFKLGALLYGRYTFPRKADEILFGDDSEYDGAIYSLYSDILQGSLEPFEVATILKKWNVADDERDFILQGIARLREGGWKPRQAVSGIFIHLEMKSQPHEHTMLSPLLVTTQNYFQTAVLLHQREVITRAGLFRIVSEMIRTYDFTTRQFASALEDLLRRQLIDKKEARKILKGIASDNPLAMPRWWLTDFVNEFTKVLEVTASVPEMILPLRKEPDEDLSLVERYLRYKPARRV